jgi:hypothetical protein
VLSPDARLNAQAEIAANFSFLELPSGRVSREGIGVRKHPGADPRHHHKMQQGD